MAIPDFQTLMLPLLRLCADGQTHSLAESVDALGNEFNVSVEERQVLLKSGQTRLYNRVAWTSTYLRKAGLLDAMGAGKFRISELGRKLLNSGPPSLDVAYLAKEFPTVAQFLNGRRKASETNSGTPPFDDKTKTWASRPDVAARISEKVVEAIPDPQARHAVLQLMAFAIENADEERPGGWLVRETQRGLRLLTGRLIALDFRKGRLRIAVQGSVTPEEVTALRADPEKEDVEFRSIQGAQLLTIPPQKATAALESLRTRFNSFVDSAMALIRRPVDLSDHCPEAVALIGQTLGRALPQPVAEEESADEGETDAEGESADESRNPIVRGRAPIFELGNQSILGLIDEIERDRIALPDLQRPFVWEDTKVRDLLDSLFVGFPVGTLVFWQAAADSDARMVGSDKASSRATTLVIDGQQRLTSLYAVIRGAEVVAQDGSRYRIQIAFRPRDGRFEVADAATRNDPEFLNDVTELWRPEKGRPQIRRDLLNGLRDAGRVVSQDYEDAVERNLDRAHSIGDYRFPTVLIRRTAAMGGPETTEEDVAEIFVRINNQGTRLRQSDFVLTLLSVFHGALRDRIEQSAKSMSDGRAISIDAQQLLRVACAVAFGRARMLAIYRFLRGVDPVTGEAEPDDRRRRLSELDVAAEDCMDLTTWRDFLIRVGRAGFVSEDLVSSKSAIVNAYALYVRGLRLGVARAQLGQLISRWVFGTLLTARYSSSSETVFERDLTRIAFGQNVTAESFVAEIDRALDEILTNDFWTHTLPSMLETPRSTSPVALAFKAAQIVLGSRALFSDVTIQQLCDPSASAARSAAETHHLFPVSWLRRNGVEDRRLINQVANLTDVGWHENSQISAQGPAQYVPKMREAASIDDERWRRSLAEHGLPIGWEAMPYVHFLRERRSRMADMIRVAYRQLGGEPDASPLSPPWFMPGTEEVWKEIAEAELGLRQAVRRVYSERFGGEAVSRIEERLSGRERESLARALRSRPSGADPLTITDYLYIGQLLPLLTHGEVSEVSGRLFSWNRETKGKMNDAIAAIAPVRNEIAHVREVERERLLRATLAASEIKKAVQIGDR
jgi:hypothetical protein